MTNTSAWQPRRNTAGTVAFSLAIAYVFVGVVLVGVTTALPAMMAQSGAAPTSIGSVFTVIAVGQLLFAAVVSLFAVIGLLRSDAPRLLAAIALGVGGSGLVLCLMSLVLPPLLGAFLYA